MRDDVAGNLTAAADARRTALAKSALRMMRSRDVRSPMHVAVDGSLPVVPALAEDSIHYVCSQAAGLGGVASVVVDMSSGDRKRLVMLMVGGVRPDDRTADERCPVAKHSQMGLLIDYMEAGKLRSVDCTFTNPEARMEIVDDGRPVELLSS